MVLRRLLVSIALLALVAFPAHAQDPDADDSSGDVADPFALDVHAFVSQGYLLGIRNNYLAKDKEHGSFEFAEVGINFTKQLTERLRAGLQLFARDLGPIGDYRPTVDWFYLDYHFADWLGLRAGRVKVPFGLYNEVNDIDAARTPVLLPQSVYPTENRDFLLAQTGVELYGYVDLDCGGALDYRVYGGTILLETETMASSPIQLEALNIPYLVGGRLLWETPLTGLRAGGSVQLLRLDADVVAGPSTVAALQAMGKLPAMFTGQFSAEVPALLWVGSIEYAAYDWLLATEYSRWVTEVDSEQPALLPETKATAERMYLAIAYRLNVWFQPGAYYSLYFPDAKHRSGGRELQQHDVALSLRFDINEHWLVKLEGHYLEGTAVLRPALNDGTDKSELKHSWGLLLAKTTAYF